MKNKGKIRINDKETKPSKEPRIGDLISVHRNGAVFSYKVLALLEKRQNLSRYKFERDQRLENNSYMCWIETTSWRVKTISCTKKHRNLSM